MKKIILIGLIATTIQLTTFSSYSQVAESDEYQNYQADNSYQTDDISYQTFYEDLSPYGQWITYPGYGSVWSPSVGTDFRPYATNGHWVYSDMGWTWVSDYSWGWATFHYGRWFHDSNYGWLWVPGYDWAPAWVSWRSSNDYYGWAPLMPGMGLNIAIGVYNPPVDYWCFVPHEFISSANIRNYYVNNNRNITIIRNTTVINNTVNIRNSRNGFFASGPNPREVEQFTHSSIHPLTIVNNNRPGTIQANHGELPVFRPGIHTGSVAVQQQFARSTNQNNGGNSHQTFFNNYNRVQNRPSTPVAQHNSQDNRSFSMNRGNIQYPTNNQTVNNNFQRQEQQRNNVSQMHRVTPAFQMPAARTMPVSRPNGNAYRQNAPVPQRAVIQQTQPANHSFAQGQMRSFGNGRSSIRK